MSYTNWMQAVDKEIMKRTEGMITSADLCDFMSRDMYDAGCSPEEGALECLQEDDLAMMFRDVWE